MKRAGVQSLVAVVLLVGCDRQQSTEALIERLGSADQTVRIKAATELARRGEEVVPDLMDALEDERPLVRDWALRTLGQMGPRAEPAIQRLIQALDDTDDDVRWSAMLVLGNLGAPSAIPSIIQKTKDRAAKVRAIAVGVLGRSRQAPGTVIPAILATLHDPDQDVRVAALNALGRFRGEAKTALPGVLAALEDGSPTVRGAAAEAIGDLGPASGPSLDHLVRLLKDDDDQSVRKAAAHALAQFGAEAVPPLAEVLRKGERFTRLAAADALGYMGAPARGALPTLKEVIEEGDPLVAATAEEALRRIEGNIAAEKLEQEEAEGR